MEGAIEKEWGARFEDAFESPWVAEMGEGFLFGFWEPGTDSESFDSFEKDGVCGGVSRACQGGEEEGGRVHDIASGMWCCGEELLEFSFAFLKECVESIVGGLCVGVVGGEFGEV